MLSRAISSAFKRPPAQPTSSASAAATRNRNAPVTARSAEYDSRKAHHRADRQIDAAGDHDRRHRHREETKLHAQPGDLEEVADGEEVRARSRRKGRSRPASASSSDPFAIREPATPPRPDHAGSATASIARGAAVVANRVDSDRRKDDAPLQRPLPVGIHAKKRQRGADRAKQYDAEQRARHIALPAAHRGAADDGRGNDLHLEADARVTGNLVEAHRVEQRREPGQRTRRRQTPSV